MTREEHEGEGLLEVDLKYVLVLGLFVFFLQNWNVGGKIFELKTVFWFLHELLMSFSSSFNKTEVNLKQTLGLNNAIEMLSLKCQH